jgi:hypothetical protein
VSQPDSPRKGPLTRSQQSVDFEQLWRGLPRAGRVPLRQSFKPQLAKAYLSNLIMVQAPVGNDPALRVRLVGDAIRQQVGRNIVGEDYFEFMGIERRPAALEIVKEMFERPCGIWWVAPVHYERGFSQYWEMTAFPLAGDEQSSACILAFVRPADSLLNTNRADQKAIRVDPAVQIQSLDVRT